MNSPAVPGGGPSPPVGGRRRRRSWWEAAVPVAVAVAVVAALFATGVIALHHGSSTNAIAFHRAEADSLAATADGLGGTWTAIGGFGLDERSVTTVPTSDLAGLLGTDCVATPLDGQAPPTAVIVPSYSGSFGSGLSPFWVLFVTNSTPGVYVVVEVLNGTAEAIAQVGGSGCSFTGTTAVPLPDGILDSPAIASAAWDDLGQSWVTTAPNLTSVALGAFGGGTSSGVAVPGYWAVVYAPCDPLLGGSVQDSAFIALFNLTVGSLVDAFSHAVDCPA